MKRIVLFSVLFLTACGRDFTSPQKQKEIDKQMEVQVIYGEDHRIENYQASEALKTLAASTVALVKSSDLVQNSEGQFSILGSQFGSRHQLCASEPFREQTVGAFCSGSLVGPDLVMTAGHCITSNADCSDVRFVFDFAVKAPGVEKKNFTSNEVYRCKEIVGRELINSGADYAIVRLDRKVTGRSPLAVRRNGVVSPGDALFVIGHPAGLPQKIAGGAQVRSVQSDHFVANLDTYGGNSGSAVFNGMTKEIEGILVRGENDFTWSGNCSVSYRCSDSSCRGEDVTRIDKVLKYIPASGGEPPPPPPGPQPQVSSFPVVAQLAIPDAPKAGIVSTVAVNETPAGRKVQVQIDIKHTYRGDLLVQLISPSGTSVTLHKQTGGSLDDLKGTFGVDLASAQSLDSLRSEARTGNWKLLVTDKASVDVGTLNTWTLKFVP